MLFKAGFQGWTLSPNNFDQRGSKYLHKYMHVDSVCCILFPAVTVWNRVCLRSALEIEVHGFHLIGTFTRLSSSSSSDSILSYLLRVALSVPPSLNLFSLALLFPNASLLQWGSCHVPCLLLSLLIALFKITFWSTAFKCCSAFPSIEFTPASLKWHCFPMFLARSSLKNSTSSSPLVTHQQSLSQSWCSSS